MVAPKTHVNFEILDAETKAYLDGLRDFMVEHFEALEARLGSRIDALETNLTRRLDRLDAKFSDRMIRIERHLGLERF